MPVYGRFNHLHPAVSSGDGCNECGVIRSLRFNRRIIVTDSPKNGLRLQEWRHAAALKTKRAKSRREKTCQVLKSVILSPRLESGIKRRDFLTGSNPSRPARYSTLPARVFSFADYPRRFTICKPTKNGSLCRNRPEKRESCHLVVRRHKTAGWRSTPKFHAAVPHIGL